MLRAGRRSDRRRGTARRARTTPPAGRGSPSPRSGPARPTARGAAPAPGGRSCGRGRRWARRRTAPPGAACSARAIATRCCWPPDSSGGRRRAWSSRPTCAQCGQHRLPVDASAGQPRRQRDVVVSGQRVEQVVGLEHEAPSRSGASRVSAVSSSRPSEVPPTSTSPRVGRSSPAAIWSSVDLPDPDGPMTAVKRAARERVGDAAQRVHVAGAGAVGAGDAVERDGDRWMVMVMPSQRDRSSRPVPGPGATSGVARALPRAGRCRPRVEA